MGYSGDDTMYAVSGNWDPTEPCFEVLNTETPRGRLELNCILKLQSIGTANSVFQ